MFPALALAFVSAQARAGRDDLAAQAAGEMHCNSVSIVQASPTEFLATGCGQEHVYACHADGDCASEDAPRVTVAGSDDPGDDAAAEAVASALTDMACACASAGLASHGSHSSHHASSSSHHKKRSQ